MEHFSWSDNVRAVLAPCLACLRTPQDDEDSPSYNHQAQSQRGPDYVPRARADELEGLLADADDAETLSLHSNFGRDDYRRRKKHRSKKGIKLFGLDLFGKPPIRLPEDEEEVEGPTGGQHRRPRTISATGLDSDAPSLDPSMIDQLSAAREAEGAAQAEGERRAKEERKRRRREKKAAKEAALALALERSQDEFEGFPVSHQYTLQSTYVSYTLCAGERTLVCGVLLWGT